MTRPAWLDGSYDDALRLVARRALEVRGGGLDKLAFDPSSLAQLLQDPTVRNGLIGGGVGVVGGALLGGKKHRLAGGLAGGLAGAAAGAGGTYLASRVGEREPEKSPAALREEAVAVQKAQEARQELGDLGADEGKVDNAVGGLSSGAASPRRAESELRGAVPGAVTQLRNVFPAIGVAAKQGRVADAFNQADVAGLKNINPLSRHFHWPTAALAAGGNAVVRHAPRLALRAEEALLHGKHNASLPSSVRNFLQKRESGRQRAFIESGEFAKKYMEPFFNKADTDLLRKAQGSPELGVELGPRIRNALLHAGPAEEAKGVMGAANRITGGRAASLAFALPLLYREWASRHGYRSGEQPIHDLVSANRTLSGR